MHFTIMLMDSGMSSSRSINHFNQGESKYMGTQMIKYSFRFVDLCVHYIM